MTAPVYLVVFRSRATEQFTAPPINWRWVQKHSQTVHRTSIGPKRLHPDTHRLQIHWPGIHITAERPQKSGQGAMEWPTAPSINWRWVRKHSQTVHRTSIDQMHFTQTPIDQKSTDLEYTITAKRLQTRMQSPFKSSTNTKRDIVDTFLHASCMFGHDPTLGLGFSYTWELESKDWWKGEWLEWKGIWMWTMPDERWPAIRCLLLRWSVFFSVSE